MAQDPYYSAATFFGLSDKQIDQLSARITPPIGWEEKLYCRESEKKDINVAFRGVSNPKALVFLVQGRAQYCREWIEFSNHMVDEGYAFVTYDPQGQGLSYSHQPGRGHHIDRYDDEVEDLEFVINMLDQDGRYTGIPWFGVGHSKGGNTLLRHVANRPKRPFNAMAQLSPATGIM